MSGHLQFHILDRVDSTNNYAMGRLREGLAEHGEVYFALEQTAGRGQRGKSWVSEPGENIMMSMVFLADTAWSGAPFIFNMAVALVCRDFLSELISEKINIKWPNDIYINDRKAGGLLIENSFRGQAWNGAVIGIGINVNQSVFSTTSNLPVSLIEITGQNHPPIALAQQLQLRIWDFLNQRPMDNKAIIAAYNQALYKKGESVWLKKEEQLFETLVLGVDEQGKLITEAGGFSHGEIEWKL